MKLCALLFTVLPWLAAAAEQPKGSTYGNPAAPITMEIFSDFECPGCKMFHDRDLPKIMKDYVVPGKVYLIYRYFPLAMHPHSRQAAGLVCAASRIGKYDQAANVLFAKQQQWSASGKVEETVCSVLTAAEAKNVKMLANDPSVLREVQSDVDAGIAARVGSTPTIRVTHGTQHYPVPWDLNFNYNLLQMLLNGFLKG